MIRREIIVIFLFLALQCYGSSLESRKDTACVKIAVDSISITGNNITQDEIILRELTFKPGDLITDKDIKFNKERVYSLGLFNNVNIARDTTCNKSNIVINVEESWYIWPIPIFDIKDSSIKKLSYGLNLLYKNFRGMNETLSAVFSFGYDPYCNFSYYNPWLIREKNISLSVGFNYNKIHNISSITNWYYGDEFNYKLYSGYVNIGKRFDLFNELYFMVGYDYIEIPRIKKGVVTASDERIDRTAKVGMSYIFDSRNLKQFPDSGVYTTASYIHKGFGMNRINYSILNLDLRYYQRIIGDLSARLKFGSRLTFGRSVPFYDNSFLGVSERVRGNYNNIREGNNYYLFTADLKYPIIKEWYIEFKLPLIPKELTAYRVGIYGNLFADAGATQFRKEAFTINSFYSGYGAGLIFIVLPYNIIRVQYANNENGKGEFIFGLGFTF